MSARPFPWTAFSLALVTAVLLAVAGVSLMLVVAVLLVWTGSLWLVGARPPEPIASADRSGSLPDRMGELFEHSETPVVITDRDRVIIANHAARDLLGAHIVGQDVRMALRKPDAIALVESDSESSAMVHGLTRRTDLWRINRKRLDQRIAVLEFVNKTIEADISRAHTDFVANASHELRTPLAAIIGYVETLQEGVDDLKPAVAERFLGIIHREAKRLQDLVSDLMSLSRIEAEKHDQPTSRIELATVVERAARDGAGAERQDRLELELERPIPILGDEQQIEQLVRNLVDNALKYGAEGQPVTVRLASIDDKRVRLSVQDRGDGIAPEHIPHLTRRFYRTDPGRSRASGGTGLGLAIVKHIVERHRGRLSVDSKLGKGTTVVVQLKRDRDQAED